MSKLQTAEQAKYLLEQLILIYGENQDAYMHPVSEILDISALTLYPEHVNRIKHTAFKFAADLADFTKEPATLEERERIYSSNRSLARSFGYVFEESRDAELELILQNAREEFAKGSEYFETIEESYRAHLEGYKEQVENEERRAANRI
jgi:hypothetical protein